MEMSEHQQRVERIRELEQTLNGGRTIAQLEARVLHLETALRQIAICGIYGEGELPLTTSELREMARAALGSWLAVGVEP